MSDSEHSPDEPFDTVFDPAVLLGQWTDRTFVHGGHVVFAIDFVRDVPVTADRVLVARALVAPGPRGRSARPAGRSVACILGDVDA